MKKFLRPIYAAAGYTTIFFGPGRREFNPKNPMPSFESYLKDVGRGVMAQIPNPDFDEGVIGSFMSARFLNQANLPGFLPYLCSGLEGRPCTGIEGACGTGGRAIATAVKTVLSGLSESVLVIGFEIQNSVKPLYGADILAGAAYYNGERKKGLAHFFPGIFAQRAGAYFKKYGEERTRKGMAAWYEQCIQNARYYPHAQEYHNQVEDLFSLAMTPPNPSAFLPYLNLYDCSKVSDGAAGIVIASEEGLKRLGLEKKESVEVVAMGAAESDITLSPLDLTRLTNSEIAIEKALKGLDRAQIGHLELHDCFSITGLLGLEAAGFAKQGEAADLVRSGALRVGAELPTNISGGLGGYGHPTGATGVRQLVDLWAQGIGRALNGFETKKEFSLMVSMGGNDKTVTAIVTRRNG